MVSVPAGKVVGGTVLVPELVFKASKMLTFPADPVGPELALPPHDVSPSESADKQNHAHKPKHVLRHFCMDSRFLSFKNASAVACWISILTNASDQCVVHHHEQRQKIHILLGTNFA